MANVKITQLPELAEAPASGDLFEVVDVSTGLNKKVQAQYVVGGGGGAVDSVNGQTGVVSIDLQSVLTEGNTANSLPIKVENVQVYNAPDDNYFQIAVSERELYFNDLAVPNSSFTINREFLTSQKTYNVPNENGTLPITTQKTSNFTAELYCFYTANGTLTVTDPTPMANLGFIVHVIGESVTIGGVAYTSGALVYRYYDGSVWISTNMNTTIDATPTDGSSNAVSSNGVFDALALKQDINRSETFIYSKTNGTFGSHTGNTTETTILTSSITGGVFEIGDWMNLMYDFTKVGTAGTATVRLRAGTTGTTADALIGTFFLLSTTLDAGFSRERLQFKTGNILSGVASNFTSSQIDTSLSTSAKQSTSLNPANTWILSVSVQLNNSADTVSCEGYVISRVKSF